MLPQFGFIVAQAGADYYALPASPPAPPPPTIATVAPSQQQQQQQQQSNNSIPSLAPLLNKSFSFGHANTANNSGDTFYKSNNASNSYNTPPYYSRQPSPSPSSGNVPILPPPSFLYSKDIIPKSATSSGFQQPAAGVLPIVEKTKEVMPSWYPNNSSTSSQSMLPVKHRRYSKSPPPPPSLSSVAAIRRASLTEMEQQEQVPRWQDKSSSAKSTARQEYNGRMTWMDDEFWEQADELYQEKLTQLQNELEQIQKGTHSAFREIIADFESKRERTISDAEYFMKYQIAFIEQSFSQDIHSLEDDYENERKHLQETLISSIEDKRKQMKDERDETNDEDTSSQPTRAKRNLRKRTAENSSLKSSEPLSKRKSVRPSILYNIHTISPLEEEELENEYLTMKA